VTINIVINCSFLVQIPRVYRDSLDATERRGNGYTLTVYLSVCHLV